MNYVKLSICSMFVLFLFIPEAYAQKPQVKNVRFVDEDKTIVVYYVLQEVLLVQAQTVSVRHYVSFATGE